MPTLLGAGVSGIAGAPFLMGPKAKPRFDYMFQ
jgi:hypothetical protein